MFGGLQSATVGLAALGDGEVRSVASHVTRAVFSSDKDVSLFGFVAKATARVRGPFATAVSSRTIGARL